MRKILLGIVILTHLVILWKRLPDWKDDKSIWIAAERTEPKDPWVLNNAAHYTHDDRSLRWLVRITELDIPKWLPIDEREPYYVGYLSLANTLRASGNEDGYYQVQNLIATKLIDRLPPKVSYVTTEVPKDNLPPHNDYSNIPLRVLPHIF